MPSGRRKTGRTTMQDIADRLGISKVSVSKAFAGKGGISDRLRREIFAAAEEMGYGRPRPEGARRFAFVVLQQFFLETDAFYSEMYSRFSELCLEKGIGTALVIVSRADLQNRVLPPQLRLEEYSAVAVAGEMPDDFLRLMEKPGRPMVLMDFESCAVSACSLLTDNYRWGAAVTQMLADRGHRRIGFVGQPGATRSITDRYFGYRRTLLLRGLEFREEWVLVNNDKAAGLYTSDISLPSPMPTAFVCHCDMAAFYLLATLRQHDLICPRDVSVISFDNTRLAESCCPPLTSVDIDTAAFARRAVELLVNKGEGAEEKRIILPSGLAERASVRSLKE